METEKDKQAITTVMVLFGVAVVVGAIIMFNKKSVTKHVTTAGNAGSTTSPTNITPLVSNPASATNGANSTTSSPSVNTSGYNDGTYSVTADYYTPEDTDTIKVTMAVQNGVITDVDSTTTTSSRESRQYDSSFLNSYKSYVIGKSLKDLNLNRVSGASLTTEGFNNALDMIRQQAQA